MEKNPFDSLARKFAEPYAPAAKSSSLSQLLASLPPPPFAPKSPSKWTQRYVEGIVARARKRIGVQKDRLDSVTQGKAIPEPEHVSIGSGRQIQLSILFLDVCGFSSWPNWTSDEQKRVLMVMNVFMAEMLNIVRDFGGVYEKNTGDGLMAYFGEGAGSDAERVKPAVEAAVVMHYVNDVYLTPYLSQIPVLRETGVVPIRFRVGIDVGPVTLARVGIGANNNSIVAIGTTANVACKLMNLIPDGGICLGNAAHQQLPHNWTQRSSRCAKTTGFIYIANDAQYPAWTLDYRLSHPSS